MIWAFERPFVSPILSDSRPPVCSLHGTRFRYSPGRACSQGKDDRLEFSAKENDGVTSPRSRRARPAARGVHLVRRSAAGRSATPRLGVLRRHSSIFWTSAPGGISKLNSDGSRLALNCGLTMSMRVSSP
ncbi:MAG: hypothetical protein MZV70_09070 [Desulfobacterales bacterium]|nr:hypothetical protein [Desulfobacterales bacterium]